MALSEETTFGIVFGCVALVILAVGLALYYAKSKSSNSALNVNTPNGTPQTAGNV